MAILAILGGIMVICNGFRVFLVILEVSLVFWSFGRLSSVFWGFRGNLIILGLPRVFFLFKGNFVLGVEAIFNQFIITIILIVSKNVDESVDALGRALVRGLYRINYGNVTFLDYDGNVINKPNSIILYCCNVIPWIKDYNNVTLQYNVESSKQNAP